MGIVGYKWVQTNISLHLNDATGDHSQPAIAGLSDGSFFGAWTTDVDGSNFDLYGRVVDISGSPTGSEFLLNSTTANGQFNANVAQLANGNVVVSFTDFGDVRARLFS